MKKKLIISIGAFVVLTFSIVVFIISITHDNVFHVTTIKSSYSIVNTYNEEEEINIPLYVSSKKAFIVDRKKANSAYILNSSNDEIIKMSLVNITDLKESKKINKKDYYLYNYCFNINLKIDNDFRFEADDAVLVIEYPSYEINNIKIEIGSFNYYKIPYYGDSNDNLILTKIKPIVNYVNGNKSIAGLYLEIYNNSKEEIVLNTIDLLNSNVVISGNDIVNYEDDFASGDEISQILGYRYDYDYDINDDNYMINIEINSKERESYIIPFKYLQNRIVSQLGFVINYQINDEKCNYYYDDFKYFDDYSLKVNNNDFVITTYEHA